MRKCEVIQIKLLWNFIQITLRHGYSPVNFLLHIFKTSFPKNTSKSYWKRILFIRNEWNSVYYTEYDKPITRFFHKQSQAEIGKNLQKS